MTGHLMYCEDDYENGDLAAHLVHLVYFSPLNTKKGLFRIRLIHLIYLSSIV